MTISPSDASRVAVYRLDGSMPIWGGDLNSCFLGADPSNGGNSEAMGPDVNRVSSERCRPSGSRAQRPPGSAARAALLAAASDEDPGGDDVGWRGAEEEPQPRRRGRRGEATELIGRHRDGAGRTFHHHGDVGR